LHSSNHLSIRISHSQFHINTHTLLNSINQSISQLMVALE